MLILTRVGLSFQRHLYRSDNTEYRPRVPEMDSGVEPGSDTTPPTPAFPISPPTPYGRVNDFIQIFHTWVVLKADCLYFLCF